MLTLIHAALVLVVLALAFRAGRSWGRAELLDQIRASLEEQRRFIRPLGTFHNPASPRSKGQTPHD